MVIEPKENPVFSVIISTYNCARYIEEAIDSILNQSFPQEEIEIVVVDDGSTDDTSKIINKYLSRIKYIRQENAGHASGLNKGFVNSTGTIIAFMDPDDFWFPEKLKYVYDIYREYDCEAVFHNLTFTGERIKAESFYSFRNLKYLKKIEDRVYIMDKNLYRNKALFLSVLSAHTYKREICNKILPIPVAFVRHTDWYLYIAALAYSPIYFIPLSLGGYRQHPLSHIAKLNSSVEELMRSISIYESALKDLEKMQIESEAKDFIIEEIENQIAGKLFGLRRRIGGLKNFIQNVKYIVLRRIRGNIIYRTAVKLQLFFSLLIPRKLLLSAERFARKIIRRD